MFAFIKILFQGMWSGAFWADRWDTFLALIRKPDDFYGGVGKKDWDENAYLMGLSFSLVMVLATSLLFSGLLSLLRGYFGLVAFGWSLVSGLIGWFIGVFLTYYVVAWVFGFAAKLIKKKDDMEKIRAIFFTLGPATLCNIVPILGGVAALVLSVLLLVVAYENSLKMERGEAVASSLLGMVFSSVVVWVPFFLLGLLSSAILRLCYQ